MRYIKYDILLETLNGKHKIEDDILSKEITLPSYFFKKSPEIIASIIKMIPLVGKDFIEGIKDLNTLKKEFNIEHIKEAERLNENAVILNFVKAVTEDERSIYEEDSVTKLIESVLSRQIENGYSENVLIIDDLDRIDPEHIFRLLNVFSAHFDRKRKGNKFGFDKIIIVCDIDNIRGIFKAKYGVNADFNGYIDKFYSYRIFDFNNKNGINKLTKYLLRKAEWARSENGLGYDNYLDFYRGRIDSKISFLYDIIDILTANGELQLRSILKLKKIHIHFASTISMKNIYYDMYEEPIMVFIRILIQLKGDTNSLIDSLSKCDKIVPIHSDVIKNYVTDLIRIYLSSNIDKNDNARKNYYLNGQQLILNDIQNEYSLTPVSEGYFICKQPELISVLIDVVNLFNIATIE